jgi:hypothetical protein
MNPFLLSDYLRLLCQAEGRDFELTLTHKDEYQRIALKYGVKIHTLQDTVEIEGPLEAATEASKERMEEAIGKGDSKKG